VKERDMNLPSIGAYKPVQFGRLARTPEETKAVHDAVKNYGTAFSKAHPVPDPDRTFVVDGLGVTSIIVLQLDLRDVAKPTKKIGNLLFLIRISDRQPF
jgi:hypothetical protein